MTNVLNRDASMDENRDPRGVQWAIFPQKGKSLYVVRAVKLDLERKPIPDEKYKIPEECEGEWTHIDKAQAQIEKFLTRIWNESDSAKERAAQKARKPVNDSSEELSSATDQSG